MRYIEKHPAAVVKYEQQLKDNDMDMLSLSNPAVHRKWKGKEVYEHVQGLSEFKNMEAQLLKDQGGVCCYCGCRIPHPTGYPQYIREHVIPREESRELAGEYSNLLLSCRGEKDALGANSLADIPRRMKKHFFHCDKSKAAKIINVSPLQVDCANHFEYILTGEVYEDGDKESDDIKILNLNCTYLQDRRKAAIAALIYDDENNLLPDDDMRVIADALSKRNVNGIFHEYYFVIINIIEGLLNH